jgi:hypothetical protein
MSRTYDITISEFDLDRLEADLSAAERSAAEQTRRANENHAWALRAERERDAERALADRLADALVATLRGNLAKMEIPIHLTRLRQRFRTILMEGGPQ